MKFRNAWSWLGLHLGRRAGTVAVIGLALTIVLGLGITELTFTTSNASYLNNNDKAQIENHAYEKLFGGDPIVTMFTMRPGTTVDDLFTPHNIAAFKTMEARLHRDPTVFSVLTPLDAIQLASRMSASGPGGIVTSSLASRILLSAEARDPTAAGRTARADNLAALLQGLALLPPAKQVLTNPAWIHFLVHNPNGSMRTAVFAFFPNPQHAAMIVFLKGHLTIAQESAAAATVQDIVGHLHFQHATTLVTGVPALLRTINNYLKGGFITLGAIAAGVMVLILLLMFTVRWRLLPFFIVAVGLIWAFGVTGYFGVPLTLGSIAGLPVLLGVGIDYAIQMHSRVEEEVVLDRADHPVQATARNLGPALLVVTFDAVFAFIALLFAKVPMIRQFGWLLIIGIVAVCVCSIVGPLAILGIREHKSPTKGKDFSKGRLSRLVVWLGSLPAKWALPFAIVSILIFAGGLAVEGRIQLQTDPLQWIDPGAAVVHNIDSLRAGIGTDNELGVLVHTNRPYSNSTADYVTTLSNRLYAKYPSLLYQGTGLYNIAYEFSAVPGAAPVPPTGALVKDLYDIAPPDIQRTLVADGGHDLGIVFESKTTTLGELQPVVTDLQDNIHPPHGITEAPGGIAVVGVGLLENLAQSRELLTYLSIILVGLFLTARLRSLIRSLLSLVPVLIAVGVAAVVAWALRLELSPMTAVSGPLVVAVCTEFTSLILLRFVEERGRGLDPRDAVTTTASRTGRAFMVSGTTAIAGIAVIASSPWPLLRGFGIIVGLNVAVALLSALVILPPVLIWAEGDGRNYVSRGLTRYIEEEPRKAPAASAPDNVPTGGEDDGPTARRAPAPLSSNMTPRTTD